MSKTKFGALNEHAVAIILKELSRRTIVEIRKRRVVFNVYEKILDSGKKDIFTDADIGAEEIILRSLRECFPNFDIISEEDKNKKYPKSRNNKWFTVDPLCGTGNFSNRSSGGIATTISMVINKEIASSYVGNVMTQEIFGYRQGSDNVYRIREFETHEKIKPEIKNPSEWALLFRGTPDEFPENTKPMVDALTGIFDKYIIDDGSLSLSAVKLWIGEVGAMILKPRTETPWDLTPILGMCQKLGFVYLKLPGLDEWKPPIIKTIFNRDFPVIMIHKNNMESLNNSLDVPF